MKQAMKKLNAQPRDSYNWHERARIYANSGYPELAFGDIIRAEILLEDQTQSTDPKVSKKAERLVNPLKELKFAVIYQMILFNERPYLSDVQEDPDAFIQSVQDGTNEQFQDEADFRNRSGTTYNRIEYPWLDTQLYDRSQEFLDEIQEDFDEHHLELRASTVVNDPSVLGTFANRSFSKGTRLFKEVTTSSEPADKNHDFLLECVLEMALRDNTHPLKIKQIRSLTGNFLDSERHMYFNPFQTISNSFQVLRPQRTNGDIFSQEFRSRFDTEIILTLDNRLQNNCWDTDDHQGIAPLYTFLNHSCNPNVKWKTGKPNRSGLIHMEVQADKTIKKGDELFITYIQLHDGTRAQNPLSVAERRRRLWPWFGADCQCSRCKREARGPRKAAAKTANSRPVKGARVSKKR